MSEDKLRRDVDRAARAERLLSDDLLTEAFMGLEDEYVTAWRSSPARDTEGREKLWQAVQIVGRVREHLKTMASNGKLAKEELDRIARHGEERAKVLGIF